MHAVGDRLVTSVQHRAEKVKHQVDHVGRHTRLNQRGAIRFGRDRQVSNLASGCPTDFFNRGSKGECSRAGELIKLSGVSIIGQCRDRNVRDVVGIDKGSATGPTGRASSPARIGSRKKFSLKFWQKKLQRRIVHSAPHAFSASSA